MFYDLAIIPVKLLVLVVDRSFLAEMLVIARFRGEFFAANRALVGFLENLLDEGF